MPYMKKTLATTLAASPPTRLQHPLTDRATIRWYPIRPTTPRRDGDEGDRAQALALPGCLTSPWTSIRHVPQGLAPYPSVARSTPWPDRATRRAYPSLWPGRLRCGTRYTSLRSQNAEQLRESGWMCPPASSDAAHTTPHWALGFFLAGTSASTTIGPKAAATASSKDVRR